MRIEAVTDIDLEDYDDEIKEYVRDTYDIDLDDIKNKPTYHNFKGNSIFTFSCSNLADEFMLRDIIEKNNLEHLLVDVE